MNIIKINTLLHSIPLKIAHDLTLQYFHQFGHTS